MCQDRAERREISAEEAGREARRVASERKMNPGSEVFLRRRHVSVWVGVWVGEWVICLLGERT